MTDKAVDMQASDLLALGANFKEQGSSDDDREDFAQVADADGDVAGGCNTSAENKRNEYSNDFGYCGTDIVSDLGTMLTAFGEVVDSKAVTELTITFSQERQPELSFVMHNHDDNAHAALDNFDLSDAIPASTGGVGCPDIWSNADTDSSPTSVTVRMAVEHVDAQDKDNKHWVGASKNARVDVTAEYIGTPSLTTTNWSVESEVDSDSNSEFDKTTVNAFRYYARN